MEFFVSIASPPFGDTVTTGRRCIALCVAQTALLTESQTVLRFGQRQCCITELQLVQIAPIFCGRAKAPSHMLLEIHMNLI